MGKNVLLLFFFLSRRGEIYFCVVMKEILLKIHALALTPAFIELYKGKASMYLHLFPPVPDLANKCFLCFPK